MISLLSTSLAQVASGSASGAGPGSLSWTDPSVRLRFAHDLPAWAWGLLAIALIALAGWSYWKLLGNAAARTGLAILRALVLLLVLAMIAGPQLVKQEERVEKDWVVVMADRSASMTLKDAPGNDSRQTREQQLRSAFEKAWPGLNSLAQTRGLLYVGFDAGAYDLPTRDGAVDLGEPKGRRTSVGRSLDQLLRRVAGKPVAGIVMLTDGRSDDTPSRGVLRQLEARQIPIFALPLGSTKGVPDFAISRVEAPSAAFVNDIVPVAVRVEARGLEPGSPTNAKVELVDAKTGQVLDSRPVPPIGPEQDGVTLTLSSMPDQQGEAEWTARIMPGTPDLTPENNEEPVRLSLVGRPLRVVYFDGYPRWEYRYLKNLLLRERSVRSSALILSADKRFIQEGSDTLDVVPRTKEQWQPFDVIVMGDLRPELFTTQQLEQIRDHVATRAGGLLWIGGSGATPAAWRGTPLADLLPFTTPAGASASDASASGGVQPHIEGVVMQPAASAERLGVLRLGESGAAWPVLLTDPSAGWSTLYFAQRIDPKWLKPTAEVLANAIPASKFGQSDADSTPLVMTMRYGAGRVVYVGTDEIWRYRHGRGEALPERFYLPLIRMLARESLTRAGKPATIEATPESAAVGEPVRVTVRLLDQALVERRPPSIVTQAQSSEPDARPIDIELRPEGDDTGEPASVYSGVWLPSDPGRFTITSRDALLSGLGLSANVTVQLRDEELRTPQADHALLESLVAATNGRLLTADSLADLPKLLPNREVRVRGTPQVETLWDKPWVWAILITLLALEWIGRRLIKLA